MIQPWSHEYVPAKTHLLHLVGRWQQEIQPNGFGKSKLLIRQAKFDKSMFAKNLATWRPDVGRTGQIPVGVQVARLPRCVALTLDGAKESLSLCPGLHNLRVPKISGCTNLKNCCHQQSSAVAFHPPLSAFVQLFEALNWFNWSWTEKRAPDSKSPDQTLLMSKKKKLKMVICTKKSWYYMEEDYDFIHLNFELVPNQCFIHIHISYIFIPWYVIISLYTCIYTTITNISWKAWLKKL